MFEQAYETVRKSADATMQVQQEMFRKWMSLVPGVPSASPAFDPGKFQKKWLEVVTELTRKQRELMEAQFSVGLKYMEDAFRLAEAKSAEELREKAVELWKKTFDALRQVYESQARELQAAVAKLGEIITDGAAEAKGQKAEAGARKAER